MMRKIFLSLLFVSVACHSQENQSFREWTDRLVSFSASYSQEKVYVHMDNTSYFLGDTIWFKAYTRETDSDVPSSVSGVLYAELWNHAGFLVERKTIEMNQGQGCGFFHLSEDSLSTGGLYELRAYTRWQLNWGERQHAGTLAEKNWFFNKTMEYEFFRDYDKLYSRVFPVYGGRLSGGGQYEPASRMPKLSLFPEGGSMVTGLSVRVAFEATRWDGAYQDGMLIVNADTIPVVHRGRGSFTYKPMAGGTPTVRFVTDDGHEVERSLPEAMPVGGVLRVERCLSGWQVHVALSDVLCPDSLALTCMHQGRLEAFCPLRQLGGAMTWTVPDSLLCAGVHQVTLFDTDGRVWADRLFFEKKEAMVQPTLTLQGQTDDLTPYGKVELQVRAAVPNATVSLAVRDGGQCVRNHDTGNILTEMLLASEIKGFVPNPEWYFEADDSLHAEALDLLMLTQGWRRFPWEEMAVSDRFQPVYPAEKTPRLAGSAHKYHQAKDYCPKRHNPLTEYYRPMAFGDKTMETLFAVNPNQTDTAARYTYFRGSDLSAGNRRARTDRPSLSREEYQRLGGDGERHPHPLRYVADAGKHTWEGMAHDGQFSLQFPDGYDGSDLSLWVTCPARWPLDKRRGPDYAYAWQTRPSIIPEYYVRLSHPYPRFAGAYSYYQTVLHAGTAEETHPSVLPHVIKMDAQEALGMLLDAGLIEPRFVSSAVFSRALARYYASFMRPSASLSPVQNPYGKAYEDASLDYMTPHRAGRLYKDLSNIDSVIVCCNFSPRAEGDSRYVHSGNASVTVRLQLGKRNITGERKLSNPGFSRPASFYHPDYSTHRPPAGQEDYRRTLYWNPNLKLDAEGKAKVTFYNNARTTHLSIEAAGLSSDGTILWNRTE